MSLKRVCDICGEAAESEYVFKTPKYGKSVYDKTEFVVALEGMGLDVCLECLVDGLRSLDDRPAAKECTHCIADMDKEALF